MIKTINDKDYTDTMRLSYKVLMNGVKFPKVTEFWRMLTLVFGLKEFELLDLKNSRVFEFESYLIDELIEWRKGNPIDFSEIKESVFTFGDFTEMEKLLMNSGLMEERLWAIYVFLVDPNLTL